MKDVKIGIIFGTVFAIIDALLMIPLNIPDKNTAILGASINRFAIGFFIPIVKLPLPEWLKGILIGFILSLPDGIITKMFIPIVGIGIIGGFILGITNEKILKNK